MEFPFDNMTVLLSLIVIILAFLVFSGVELVEGPFIVLGGWCLVRMLRCMCKLGVFNTSDEEGSNE